MNAVAHDLLDVLHTCLDALRDLEPCDRRRLLSALTAVLDLVEPARPEPQRPTPTVREYASNVGEKQEAGLHSPHYACAPEDVPEKLEEPEEPEEVPPPAAPKGRRRGRQTQRDRSDEKLRKLASIMQVLKASTVPLCPSEIAQQTGLDTGIVSYRLREMERAGELVRTGPARRGAYQLPSTSRVQASTRTR
jgi:hypothetical protein